MRGKIAEAVTIGVTTLVPWMALRIVVGAILDFPRSWFVVLHLVVAAVLFGCAFALYFRARHSWQAFTAMVVAFSWIMFFEVTLRPLWFGSQGHLFTYLDWFIPGFVIVSVIYGIGRLYPSSETAAKLI